MEFKSFDCLESLFLSYPKPVLCVEELCPMMEFIHRCISLKELKLSGCHMDHALMDTFFSSLRPEIGVQCYGICPEDGIYESLRTCKNLQGLSVSNDFSEEWDLIDVKNTLTLHSATLTSLSLERFYQLQPTQMLDFLCPLTQLVYLDLSYTAVSNELISLLVRSSGTALKTVILKGSGFHECDVLETAAVAAGVTQQQQQQLLNSFDDCGLEMLCRGCPCLTELNVAYNWRLSAPGVARCIPLCTRLTVLDVSCLAYPHLQNKHVRAIAASCTRLRKLNLLRHQEVTDEGIAFALHNLHHLTDLSIDSPKITMEAFRGQKYKVMCRLQRLECGWECRIFQAHEVTELRKVIFPRCDVIGMRTEADVAVIKKSDVVSDWG